MTDGGHQIPEAGSRIPDAGCRKVSARRGGAAFALALLCALASCRDSGSSSSEQARAGTWLEQGVSRAPYLMGKVPATSIVTRMASAGMFVRAANEPTNPGSATTVSVATSLVLEPKLLVITTS